MANEDYKDKGYFIIDQQIVRHFLQYSKCPLPFYVTEIAPFPDSRISADHDKGWYLANCEILIVINVLLV